MRILIIGSDINAYSLAKKFSEEDSENLVFVAPGNKYINDFATSIDIRENDVDELLEFALANEMNLTVCTGSEAIISSIGDVFKSNNLPIIAPSSEAAKYVLNSSIAKKFLYKNRVKTPKFAVFDKENTAIDYARKSKFPIAIKNDFNRTDNKNYYCYTFSQAKSVILDFFENPDTRIVVEDYLPYKKITQYFLSDGYTAFPFGSVEEFNMSDEKLINQKIDKVYFSSLQVSNKLLSKLMKTTIHPLLDEISSHSGSFVGIIGVDLYISQDSFEVIDFSCGIKKFHMQVILPLIKNHLYNYFYAATSGSLADDYNEIEFISDVSISVPVSKDVPSDDVVFSKDADISVISAQASNLNIALLAITDILDEVGVSNASSIAKSFEEAVFYA